MADLAWRGMAGHFIAAHRCCFHLHTCVKEKYRVSTIGCYHPAGTARPTHENREEVGVGRLYETMVFSEEDGEVVSWSEIDSDTYNDEAEAEAGHMAMVEKFLEVA